MGIINVLKLAAKPVTKFLQKNTTASSLVIASAGMSVPIFLLSKYRKQSSQNPNTNHSQWQCNATPPNMRSKRRSLLEGILTFDSNAIKDATSYHSTKNLTGFDKIYGDFHNAAVAMYNPIAARELLHEKYPAIFG